MITLRYASINSIRDDEINKYVGVLPESMAKEINRYHNIPDRKARLLGRLMLQDCIRREGLTHLMNSVSRTSDNKPHIEGWNSFNISHSGEMVVLAHDSLEIGIDIEKVEDLDYEGLVYNFHPNEKKLIANSADAKNEFYHLWVKKEAALKAIGIGITDEMQMIDCSGDSFSHKEHHLHFHSLDLFNGYICYLCTPTSQKEIKIDKFFINNEI